MGSERASLRRSSIPWSQVVCAFLFLTLVIAGLYLGYLAYRTVRAFVADLPLGSIPVLPLSVAQQPPQHEQLPESERPAQAGQAVQTPGKSEVYPSVENKDRVNILFLGIDQRPGESTACRTDTMILVSVNPKDMSASLLSIPRDLWVPIPGHGEGKINTAHYLGETSTYPGGGPALAKHTVRYNLGVPVHYYVRLNFVGFERLIDSIGGVDIDVPVTIDDYKYPKPDLSYEHLYIEAGRHHFDGAMALKYARTRRGTGDGDFSRMDRQQQVIMAVRDKVLSLPNLPQLILQSPQIAQNLGGSLATDIPPNMMLTLARWAQQIKADSVRRDILDRRVTEDKQAPDGQAILVYNREKGRPVIEALFTDPVPATTATTANNHGKLEAERARVAVYNGTRHAGLADRISAFLRVQGINVAVSDNADRQDYRRTTIRVYVPKPVTLQWITTWLADLGVQQPDVQTLPQEGDVDLMVIVGQDFPIEKIGGQQ